MLLGTSGLPGLGSSPRIQACSKTPTAPNQAVLRAGGVGGQGLGSETGEVVASAVHLGAHFGASESLEARPPVASHAGLLYGRFSEGRPAVQQSQPNAPLSRQGFRN